MDRCAARYRYIAVLQHNFGQRLVHRQGGAHITGACILDFMQIKCSLHLSVLAVLTVKREKYNVGHTAKRNDVCPKETSRLVGDRAGYSAVKCMNVICRPVNVIICRERVHQIRILIAEEHIEENGLMTTAAQSLADSYTGNDGDRPLR